MIIIGTGEAIIRFSLARKLAEALSEAKTEDVAEVIYRILQDFCSPYCSFSTSCKNLTLIDFILIHD